MNNTIILYLLYLLTAAGISIAVGRSLFTNARRVLLDAYGQDEDLTDSVKNLLLMGFYLLTFGLAMFTLEIYHSIDTFVTVIETLSTKVGFYILFVGATFLLNVIFMFKMRKQNVSVTTTQG